MGIIKQVQWDSLLPGHFTLAKSRHKMPSQTEIFFSCSRFFLKILLLLLLSIIIINHRSIQLLGSKGNDKHECIYMYKLGWDQNLIWCELVQSCWSQRNQSNYINCRSGPLSHLFLHYTVVKKMNEDSVIKEAIDCTVLLLKAM